MESSPQADKIMEFTLRHVPFDGWTVHALKRGAIDADMDPHEAIEIFGDDPLILIEYYSHMVDRQMSERVSKLALDSMKIRDKIATCVMTRLEIMAPYRESSQKAATLLSFPSNIPLGSRLLYKTVDTIWVLAGDTATDFNFYTKRATLAAVYSATMLYWFRDMSPAYANTRAFLNRRLDNVMAIPKIKANIASAVDLIKKPIMHFFRKK
jgi:ubiquinone biosynthesis protein COQ9